ncbi:hypothetical protein B296_00002075 [Ensete ventricosum]|uniref:Uncharacterized protein n=1 Tax=Ensete ventricosum TaxID=4639 RepID=A0A427B003_ENSVE|nr:hypothetical protein B296_00002075 [Ensete ventricosum]
MPFGRHAKELKFLVLIYRLMFLTAALDQTTKRRGGRERHLLQIQSPDFHPARPPPPPPPPPLPKPYPRERGMSPSKPPPPPPTAESSFRAQHLKQLERLAKLWAPQEQYQSPGRTSEPLKLKEDPPRPPPPPPPKLAYSERSLLGLESPHRWHESRRLKLRCWQDLQVQSPGFLFILPTPTLQDSQQTQTRTHFKDKNRQTPKSWKHLHQRREKVQREVVEGLP